MKEKIPSDENEPDETQVKEDDGMDIEQGDGLDAASPVTEQSRRDRKFWKIAHILHADCPRQAEGLRGCEYLLRFCARQKKTSRRIAARR
jgi:hypothetical protein